MATSESPEELPAETEPEGATTDWKAEATRLRQELAKAKDLNRQVQPYAQLGYALQQAKGGNKIVEKLSKGEPLTAAQEAKLESAGESAGLTLEAVQELLARNRAEVAQEVEQRFWYAQRAQKATERMHEKMAEELPGYENIYQSDDFNRRWQVIANAIQSEQLEVPDGDDPFEFIAKRAYHWIASENPDMGKLKPVRKTGAEKTSARMKAGSRSEAAPEEGNRELEEALREAVPPGGKSKVGRSLQELRRS